jgi:hypothetical protein
MGNPGNLPCIAFQRSARFLSLALSLLLTPFFPCACGHLPIESLPITVASCALGWCGYLYNQKKDFRLVRILSVVIATILVVKNIGDIVWFGHAPLLR